MNANTKIFFCGEIVADLLEQKRDSGDFKLLLGGSQFHGVMGASRALLREKIDVQIGFVGPISQDTFGDRFYKALEEAHTDVSGIKRVVRNTTLAIVSIRPGQENAFSFYGRDTAEQMTKIEDLPEQLIKSGDKVICCFGSISTVMEPARFAWLEFAKRQRTQSLVIYDLNTRPSVISDKKKYQDIIQEWAGTAHVMKASDADIAWTYPGQTTKQVAELWLASGASMAVFTKGLKGAEAHTRSTSCEVSSLDLVAPSTVGAGDNFNAGLAIEFAKAGFHSPQPLEQLTIPRLSEILQGANNAAAYHLISIGAQPKQLLKKESHAKAV